MASQPMPTSVISLVSDVTVPTTKPAAAQRRKRRSVSFRRLRAVLGGLGGVIYDGLVALSIVLLYGIPGTIFVVIAFGCVFTSTQNHSKVITSLHFSLEFPLD